MICANHCPTCRGDGSVPSVDDDHDDPHDDECLHCDGTGCRHKLQRADHCSMCAREGGFCQQHAGITYQGAPLCLECARAIAEDNWIVEPPTWTAFHELLAELDRSRALITDAGQVWIEVTATNVADGLIGLAIALRAPGTRTILASGVMAPGPIPLDLRAPFDQILAHVRREAEGEIRG